MKSIAVANMPEHDPGDDPPRGHTGVDDEDAAEKAGEGRGLTNRALDRTDERIHPGHALLKNAGDAAFGPDRERRRAGDHVDRRCPYGLAGHLDGYAK